MSDYEPQRLPIVTDLDARAPGYLPPLDAGLVNAIAERVGEQDYIVETRPGSNIVYSLAGATQGYGIFNLAGEIMEVSSVATVSTLFRGNTPSYAVAGITGQCRFAQINFGTTAYRMVFGDSVATWVWDSTGAPFPKTLASYSSGAFPPGPDALCKGFAFLDGTLYVMDIKGFIWGSGVADLTTWDPLNVLQANEEADAGVYITKHLNQYVVAMKEWSTEFFYDNANEPPGSPLSVVKGASIPLGCASADSVQEIDSEQFWLTSNRSGNLQVARLTNLNASIVSSPKVEKLLVGFDLTQVRSATIRIEGHRLYILTSITSNITLVLDIDQKLWYQWSDSDGNYFPLTSITYVKSGGVLLHYAQHETDGNIYQIAGSSTFPTDNGVEFSVDIYTPRYDAGVAREKHLGAMFFIVDKIESYLQVRCNDSDFDPTKWTNFRPVKLSSKKPALFDCGSFSRRSCHFRHRAPIKLRIKAVELQMDIGDA